MKEACGLPLWSSLTRNGALPPGTNVAFVSEEKGDVAIPPPRSVPLWEKCLKAEVA